MKVNARPPKGAPPQETTKSPARPEKLAGANAGGSRLPEAVQRKMESAFGHDFSRVRVHQNGHAESIGAHAYAQGEHLHFAAGRYSPHSREGQKLLGHELAHVVQQRAGRVPLPQGKGLPINDDRGLEAEADALGTRAAEGRSAGVSAGRRGEDARASGPIQGSIPGGIAPIQCGRRLTYIRKKTLADFSHVDFKAAKREKYRNLLYGRVNERALKYRYKKKWRLANPGSAQSGFLDTNRLLGNSGGIDGVLNDLLLQSKLSWKGKKKDQVPRLANAIRKAKFDADKAAAFLRQKKKGETKNWFEKLHEMHQGTLGAPRTTPSVNPNHNQRFQGILPPTLAGLPTTATKKDLSEAILPLLRYAIPTNRVDAVKDHLDNSRSSHFNLGGVQTPFSSLVVPSGISTKEAAEMVEEMETKHIKYT